MNDDFETRARAAARAVHVAVDTPAVDLATAPRPHRGPTRALLVAAAVVAIAAVVGTTLVTRDEGAGPASDLSTFCAQVGRMVTTPVDRVDGEPVSAAPSLDFLRDAPEEIRPSALAMLRARTEPSARVSIEDTQRFLTWWQLRCFPDAATTAGGAANARFAPAPTPAGFRDCGASNTAVAGTEQQIVDAYGTIAVYGDPTLPDPYSGRMIAVVRTTAQQFYRDDHAVPAVVAGHPDAELIDATGMYGAPIEGLGQAVTWKDDRGFIAVIGRGYTREAGPELEAIAARVGGGPDGDELADAARDGLERLSTGPVADVYAQYPSPMAATTFSVNYLVRDFGSINLYGLVADPATLEATRFFAPALRHASVGGKDVITGTVPLTNSTDGSTVRVVMWRDGEVMLTARVLDQAGTDPRDVPTAAEVDALVAATRRLDRGEWEHLVEAGTACLLRDVGESDHASGSDSSSGTTTTTTESPTSTTAPVGTPAP